MWWQYFCVVVVHFIVVSYAEDNLIVSLKDGLVRGSYKESYNGRQYIAFEGIPYAKPPIGDLRFEDPKPVEPWSGVLPANYLYTCLQLSLLGDYSALGQEDCLYLNVYVPRQKINPNEKLDVIFHIHGGAFMIESPAILALPTKIMDRDVVFVSVNYRLGPLGFYSAGDGRGNYGLKDQTAGLKWVQKNIKNFGGNKNSVTITGASAGGASTHLHYFSKLSKGLFHKGFAQNGVALNPWVIRNHPERHAKILAKHVGCLYDNVKDEIKCLKQRPALQIVNALNVISQGPLLPLVAFGPIVEKDSPKSFLTKSPYEQLSAKKVISDVPLLASMTTDEGTVPAALMYGRIDELNENWNKWAPLMMEYYEYEDERRNEVSQKIKEHYLKNESLTKANFKSVIDACSHRIYHLGGEQGVRLQAQAAKSKAYFLLMGYAGRFMPSDLPGFDVDLGIGHCMDGKFYYDGEFYVHPEFNQEEERMKDILLDMLVSFAKTGKPTIAALDIQPLPKNGDMNYLYVGGPDDMKMSTDDVFGPRSFWKTLGLYEDQDAKS